MKCLNDRERKRLSVREKGILVLVAAYVFRTCTFRHSVALMPVYLALGIGFSVQTSRNI